MPESATLLHEFSHEPRPGDSLKPYTSTFHLASAPHDPLPLTTFKIYVKPKGGRQTTLCIRPFNLDQWHDRIQTMATSLGIDEAHLVNEVLGVRQRFFDSEQTQWRRFRPTRELASSNHNCGGNVYVVSRLNKPHMSDLFTWYVPAELGTDHNAHVWIPIYGGSTCDQPILGSYVKKVIELGHWTDFKFLKSFMRACTP